MRFLIAACLACLSFVSLTSWAVTNLPSNAALQLMPSASVQTKARLTVLFFDVYDAQLIAANLPSAVNLYESPFAFSLMYLRDFAAEDILSQTEKELVRQTGLSAAQASSLTVQLKAIMPSIKKGERLTAAFNPSSGLSLWHGDALRGRVSDLTLAKAFLDIWLGEATSQSNLRKRLLNLP